ncbi:peptidylprolyl isomerase [Aquisalimonas asiatica]|uniref:Chaperone SurA n=1 Tax=Aquisalimonas asiatica TaxID=406100 RepID=A0A1H8VDK1_9GAMM|nr:peptidylprolyl isomerase [Aquisalimonas asiatica]SEP13257.1 periplasmic chaperone for outer membrane proteins SurA [Aquisalimonas asiatica]
MDRHNTLRPTGLGLAALLLAAWLFTGTTPVVAQTLDRIVAVVNEDVILQSELEAEIATVHQRMQAQNQQPPPQDALIDQVMEQLIMERLQLAQANRMGIGVDDNTLNAAVQRIAQQNNMNLQQFRQAVAREGMDFAQFREDLRTDIKLQRLHQQQVQRQIEVTSRDIEEFLESSAGGADDMEFRVAHILLSVPEGADPEAAEEAEARAEELLTRLRDDGEDFATVAAEASDAQDALEGGDLGWRQAGELPSMFQDEVMSLSNGEIAGPIRSSSGVHIVKLVDSRSSDQEIVEQTRARHILIQPSEVVSREDARTRLESLRDRIEQGESFGDLARAHSDDQGSASRGGDLDWVSPGQLVPEFEETMDSLEPGEISEPFETQFGWHIVQVAERREHDSTQERRRAQAVQQIRERRSEETLENWLRELRDDAYVEVRLDN